MAVLIRNSIMQRVNPSGQTKTWSTHKHWRISTPWQVNHYTGPSLAHNDDIILERTVVFFSTDFNFSCELSNTGAVSLFNKHHRWWKSIWRDSNVYRPAALKSSSCCVQCRSPTSFLLSDSVNRWWNKKQWIKWAGKTENVFSLWLHEPDTLWSYLIVVY